MRGTPWNLYRLVDKEIDIDLQLASGKNRLVCSCASFVCFGRTTAGIENLSHMKVGPAQNQEVLRGHLNFEKRRDLPHSDDCIGNVNINRRIFCRKSCLKKPDGFLVAAPDSGNCTKANKVLFGKNDTVACQTERKKVQWTDTSGGELFQIREFEMSEDGSDGEFAHGKGKACSCCVM